ncbi:glucose-6-phosphate dehydrogenase [Nitrospira sp. Nam74]
MIRRLVIFGASGDLTGRYLMPAIASLHQCGRLPPGFRVLGVAREDWDTEGFRRHIGERLDRHAACLDPGLREAVLKMLEYRRADVADPKQAAQALYGMNEPIVIYLALPPSLYEPVINALATVALVRDARLVIEKPFGLDLASAQALNRLLHDTFPERQVYRIDHFLHQQTVQNLLGLRFANRIFEPLWSLQHVQRIDIIWDETLALEGRAGYYDTAGALRDMVQNHLLQLLTLVAMEPPQTLNERDFRDRKVDVLRAVRRLSSEEVRQYTKRGRYRAGRIGDRLIPNYTDEPGVDSRRRTETFAEVTLFIDNWRWAGVPFMLRTGKALSADRHDISIAFKSVPHLAFGQRAQPVPNVLRLDIDPDHIALSININGPGDPFDLEQSELKLALAARDIPPYGHVVIDILEGNPMLSIRDDEAEEAWRIVEPILAAWTEPDFPLLEYAAGFSAP